MTRGNQREIDRQRAANRHAGKGAAQEGDPTKRRENDAKALQDKIAAKQLAKAAVGTDTGGGTNSGGGKKK